MKSIVEVEIDKPQEEVAMLFADPGNNPKWMHDLAGYEPISGDQGMPGFSYRLLPKEGDMIFLATIVESNLPDMICMKLRALTVDVAIKVTFTALSSTRTKLISEEEFSFNDSNNTIVDSAKQNAIRAAHRQHIEDFKSFAEHD